MVSRSLGRDSHFEIFMRISGHQLSLLSQNSTCGNLGGWFSSCKRVRAATRGPRAFPAKVERCGHTAGGKVDEIYPSQLLPDL